METKPTNATDRAHALLSMLFDHEVDFTAYRIKMVTLAFREAEDAVRGEDMRAMCKGCAKGVESDFDCPNERGILTHFEQIGATKSYTWECRASPIRALMSGGE